MRKTLFAFVLVLLTLAAPAFAITCGQDTGYGGADQYGICSGTCTGTNICRWNQSTNVCECVAPELACERGNAGELGRCARPPDGRPGGLCAPRAGGYRCE